jgi:prepilin-type N-terminal cleavage/methylation domain-containing protein
MMRRSYRNEGFSLVEIMIALALLALVLALISPALTNLFGSTNRTAAAGSTQSSARTALVMIQQDLERALGDRPTGDFDNAGSGSTTSLTSALNDTNPRRHDIVRAGRVSLGFYSDVISATVNPNATGPEFVGWSLAQDQTMCGATTPNWCIVRAVWNADRTTNYLTEIVTSGRGAAPTDQYCAPGATDTASATPQVRLFCYRRSVEAGSTVTNAGVPSAEPTTNLQLDPAYYRWNGNWRGECTQIWSDPTSASGMWPGGSPPTQFSTTDFVAATRNSVDPPYRFHAFLDTITSVGVVIPAANRRGGQNERSIEYAEIPIQSRQSPLYRTAIMCGSR